MLTEKEKNEITCRVARAINANPGLLVEPSPESQGHSSAFAVAGGCLPVLVAEILKGFETAMARAKAERDGRKYDDSVRHYMNGRVDTFHYAIAQTKLIQRLVCADERQPEPSS